MATLIPALDQLRAEFDQVFPRRDRRSDGWIADALHGSTSHHQPDESSSALRAHDSDGKNEVHALDVDEDLNDAQTTMTEAVMEVWRRHRDGRDNRITEIIYEGRIATAARGWVWRDYSGSNPHDKHAHFTGSYVTTREQDRRPFGVAALARREDPPVAEDLTPAAVAAVRDAVWEKMFPLPHPVYGTGDRKASDLLRYIGSMSTIVTQVKAELKPQLDAIEAHLIYIRQTLDQHAGDPADPPPPNEG